MRLKNIDLEKYTWEHKVKNILNDIIIHKRQICKWKMRRIGIHFFKTCWLIYKNMKFGSNSNQ